MRNTVVTIVLAILAAATSLVAWRGEDTAPPVASIAEAKPLGYYARGARLYRTDEEGRFSYHVFAERLDEVPGEEQLHLTGVTAEFRPADETAWSLTAASARYARDGSQLELTGNVEVRSSPADGSKPVTIAASRLLFSPDTSSAESDGAVTVRVGDWQLEAVGLRADLKEDTLQLESEVHGTLAP